MKLTSKPLFGLCAVAAGAAAIFCFTHVTSCWGKDSTPQPVFKVSSTPIKREAGSGNSYAPIVKKAAPSVVNIYSTKFVKERLRVNPMFNDPFFRQFFGNRFQPGDRELTRKEQSLGSGVIVSPDGYILTANHVVDDADEIKVSISGNKTEYTAKVIGKDQATDIAVLKIDANDLPAITLADSDQLEVGDVVLALGNPFGVGQTVTMGIVSALGRSGLEGFNQYQDFIQTDAAINPGNSGGALVDTEGRLVGINTAIVSPSGGNNGIGFAVPINMARHVLESFVSGGKVTRGYLGIIPQDIDAGLARQFDLPNQNGALVGDVMPGTPAAKAGLKAGDVIVTINNKQIQDAHDLQITVSQLSPGTVVSLKVIRNGYDKNIAVTLAELPGGTSTGDDNAASGNNSMPDALDGVTVADLTPQVREQLNMPDSVNGALVADVNPDSNSADADLRPNDVIVEINRQPVKSAEDAVNLCKAAKGDEILVKIWRRVGSFAGTRYLSVDNTKHAQ
jgi:serine protease Do